MRRSRLRLAVPPATLAVLVAAGGLRWAADRTLGSVNRDHAVTAELARPPAGPGEAKMVLVVGTDDRSALTTEVPGAPAGERADAIVVVRAPPTTTSGPLRALSLPRDLLVEIDGAGPQKLAAALELGGSALLVRTVRALTGMAIHHYVEVDFDGFARSVDRLGGVTVDFPRPTRDPFAGLWAEAGPVRLDGEGALAFVRARNVEEMRDGVWVPLEDGDLGRVDRQHQLLRAALAQARSGPKLDAARWLASAGPHVTVDARLTVAEARRLADRLTSRVELAVLPTRPLAEGQALSSPFAPAHVGGIRYLVPAEGAARVLATLAGVFGAGP